MLKKSLAIILCLVTGLFTHIVLAKHKAMIHDAWIADAPPVAKIRAGYLKIHNKGTHPIIINDYNSPDFQRIELHKTIMENGMMKMQRIEQLTIKPGQRIEFKPGGYHLMMFKPQRNLKKGDKVKLIIRINDDMTTAFTLTVRKRGDITQHNHDHHQHH